jgi:hypothetical protein
MHLKDRCGRCEFLLFNGHVLFCAWLACGGHIQKVETGLAASQACDNRFVSFFVSKKNSASSN